MGEHKRSFKNLIYTCRNITKEQAAEKIYRPIDRDLFLLDREQFKIKEAQRIINEQMVSNDLGFANRMFVFHNDELD